MNEIYGAVLVSFLAGAGSGIFLLATLKTDIRWIKNRIETGFADHEARLRILEEREHG